MIIKQVKNSIFSILTAGEDPPTGGGVFFYRVPDGVPPPWTRYYIVSHTDEGAFHTDSPCFSFATVQVDVVTGGDVSTEAEDEMQKVVDRLDGAELSIDNGSWTAKMKRTPETLGPFYDDKEKVWVITTNYKVIPRQ